MVYFCCVLLFLALCEVENNALVAQPLFQQIKSLFVCALITLFCIVLGNIMHIPRKILFFQ